MLKAIFTRVIDRFERRWRYDASYMRHILRGSPASFARFSVIPFVVDRRAAPAEALAAAGIVGTIAEDCGPCTQISVDMAAAGGARPEVLRAILAGDEAAMGDDARLAWRFARASLARDLDAVDPLREEVVRRWGDRGLVALSLSLMTARMYPTVKYALGYGRTCSKVTVAGRETAVAPVALAA
ncbi:MAG: hypothetical protein JNK30_01150 [Phenylobacterium sp.]|uniref:hypothetical protein n=1 Tax=Phenylobacterium sp. TaxID=1871053 RepID=UPI001A41BF22|nr:hypothetical protein [Phenylobacterium sp.]MBL8769961.1 hypothetical protein [Phenylobacterium sp.]